ncbi:MAG: methyl-accepting chemotaxis protein, partial [Spirochaetes bacterium]|nr:methyl-accepting chemotaxis protein [Spirochaetota bacterium]
MKLRSRLVLSYGLIVLVGSGLLIGITMSKVYVDTKSLIEDSAAEMAGKASAELAAGFEIALARLDAAGSALAAAKDEPKPRDSVIRILGNMLSAHAELGGVWAVFAPNALDGKDGANRGSDGSAPDGRFAPYWNRFSGSVVLEPCVDYDDPGDVGLYYREAFTTGKPFITAPTEFEIAGTLTTVVSVCAPIVYKGRPIGTVGIDFSMEAVKDIASAIKPYGSGYVFLVSTDGTFVTHPEQSLVGQNMGDFVAPEARQDTLARIADGKSWSSVHTATGESFYTITTPVRFSGVTRPWSMGLVVPMDTVLEPVMALVRIALILAAVIVVASIVASVLIAQSISKPILLVSRVSEALERGDLTVSVDQALGSRNDEVGVLARSMRATVTRLHDVVLEVQSTASEVAAGTDEMSTAAQQMATGIAGIADSSQQLSQGATEQAASAEEVSASVEQMGANIKQNADNSFQTEKIATKAA